MADAAIGGNPHAAQRLALRALKLVVKQAECVAESSAYMERSNAVLYRDPMLNRINEVGIRTLHNCTPVYILKEFFEEEKSILFDKS